MRHANNKGVTLASLTIYVIVATIVVGILTFLNTQFFANISELTKESKLVSEKLNLKAAILKDLKAVDDVIVTEYSPNLVRLSNNVQYELRVNADGKYAIYRNDVKICSKIYPMKIEGKDSPYFDYDFSSRVLKFGLQFADTPEDTRNTMYRETGGYLIGKSIKQVVNNGVAAKECVVRYYSNSEYNESNYQYKNKEETVYLFNSTRVAFTPPTGYYLAGWSTSEVATEPEYSLGQAYAGDSISLYAVWKLIDNGAADPHANWQKDLIINVASNFPKPDGTLPEAGDTIDMEFSASILAGGIVEFPATVSIVINVTDRDSITINNALTIGGDVSYDFDDATNSYIFTWVVEDENSIFNFVATVNENVPAGSSVNTDIEGAGEVNIPSIPIEATVSIQRDIADKNIVIVLDTSRSMLNCTIPGHNNNMSANGCSTCARANIVSDTCSIHGSGSHIKRERANSWGWGGSSWVYSCTICAKYNTRNSAMKRATKAFTASVLNNKGAENITFTIINFNSKVYACDTLLNPTYNQVASIVDNVATASGTYTREGIQQAFLAFSKATTGNKANYSNMLATEGVTNILVFLADGQSTSGHSLNATTLSNINSVPNIQSFAVGIGEYSPTDLERLVGTDHIDDRIFTAEDADTLVENFETIADAVNNIQTSGGYASSTLQDRFHIYNVILTYLDTYDVKHTLTCRNETELAGYGVTIDSDNNITWDVAGFLGCRNFVIKLGNETATY